ncbi:MAG: glycosyl hydrolase 115 family protein [Verrucomicrobiota bacterium]
MNPLRAMFTFRAPFYLLLLPALLWPARPAFAQLSLVDSPGPDAFVLCDGHNPVPILVEPGDDPAVLRAAGDLAADIARVTGLKPALLPNAEDAKNLIIAGTLGRSQVIDRLAAAGKIQAGRIRGGWESFLLQVVDNPLPGVDAALVIAGSDRRGTIYGLYQLSEWIGVSPWYWWADVPPKQRNFLALHKGIFTQGPPAVKYRGIFLNDEDWGLRPWAAQTLEPDTANIGPNTCAKVFELLLRLRANFLWPAMHPGTPAFNSFPTNKEIARLYAIVMGSSHCEQMLRDNIDEWKPEKNGEYNYVLNRDGVLHYWEERVRENAAFENVYTLGMRGIHDDAMPGGGAPSEKAARLLHIIQDQRSLLARWVNTNLSAIPQIFCPYKEVLDLYRLAPDIPSDITLLWPDDNYGYVRQFSDARERARPGGAGVYYHVSYWGRPQDYLWLCSTPPALIGEEMSKAFDYGANQVWMLNVGDLKPAEMDIEFFLKLAWDPHSWNPSNTDLLMEQQFARDFGPDLAPQISALFAEYNRLNFQRKPEHMASTAGGIFSCAANGDEAAQRLQSWRDLGALTAALVQKLPPEMQDAFFELIGYPVLASLLMNEKWLALSRYQACSRLGRTPPLDLLAQAQSAQQEIARQTDIYNNRTAAGKWRFIMSDNPRAQPVFALPKIPVPPMPSSPARLGLVLEGADHAVFASPDGAVSTNPLPQFSKLTRRSYFVDVFNAGSDPLRWTAAPGADWIQLSRSAGGPDARLWVTIDWTRAPAGNNVQGLIRFTAANRQSLLVLVSLFNPADTAPMRTADFVEDNHHIVAQAAHASAVLPGLDARWETIRGLGYNGSAVSVFPTLIPVRSDPQKILAESPSLQFKIWMLHPGDWHFTVRALPTFSVEAGRPQRYAIALDNETPVIVALPVSTSETDRRWQEDVLRNAAFGSSSHPVARPGLHTLKIWMVDPGIVIDTIAADDGHAPDPGYLWPPETRPLQR